MTGWRITSPINGWSCSPLDQINTYNVKDLEVAWIHVPGHSTRGLQSMPLAADGILYYPASRDVADASEADIPNF
jgi:glucose dehydrogenase